MSEQTDVQRDQVYCAQAERFFEQKNFLLAAKYYGKTTKSFEEISLKFIRLQYVITCLTGNDDASLTTTNNRETRALQSYLTERLAALRTQDLTQRTIICTWLTEIYLDQLNRLEGRQTKERYNVIQDEFKSFLQDNKTTIARAFPTIQKLISSHGRVDELLFVATLVEDFESVISHHTQRGQFVEALQVLRNQSRPELYYKHAPILMHHIPCQTVSALIKVAQMLELEPAKLIPALMRYDVSRNEDRSVHVATPP